MSRSLCAVILLVVLTSCSGSKAPPRNLDDACSIVKQRPDYLKAFRSTKNKWGVPISVQMATIHQESRYRSDARTPYRYVLGVIPMGRQSSAYGFGQALTDCFQVDTDSISAPYRPLVKGTVSVRDIGAESLTCLILISTAIIFLNPYNILWCILSIVGLATYT